MDKEYYKLPRIYLDQDIEQSSALALDEGPAHYFRSVLRRQVGDHIRIFNGRDGEWRAELTALGKRNALANPIEQTKEQTPPPSPVHLLFAPIKKQRLSWLIEKAVELGATDLHPVLTSRTENRKINPDRIESQITEALEQCERMHRPHLHNLNDLKATIQNWNGPKPVHACIERREAKDINAVSTQPVSFLIGPEGGFDDDEIEFLSSHANIEHISLGETVYRAETACIICLTHANALHK